MNLNQIITALTGSGKQFEILDRDISNTLDEHAKVGMAHYYDQIGMEKEDSDWQDILDNMSDGPGVLHTDNISKDFNKGIGLLPHIAEGTKLGKVYETYDDCSYSIFYFEPSHDSVVVDENEDSKFLGTSYIVGETYEFPHTDRGAEKYTRAEHRDPDEPLERSIFRPNVDILEKKKK